MQHSRPPSAFSEMAIYGTIIAFGGCGFLAYVWFLYATNFDLRQSLLGSGLLFILLWEFIFWIVKGHAQTDEERDVAINKRKQIYWVYAWLFISYFRIWHTVIPLLLIALLYKIVRDRKFRQVSGQK